MNRTAMPNLLRHSRYALVLLGALASACSDPADDVRAQPPLQGASIGGEFTLTATDGRPVRWSQFDGRYRIVYFGYAYCPDICPTDVQRMTKGLAMFAQDNPNLGQRIQPIFITIDPERDTPEVIAQFTNAFSDDLLGLTGSQEQIADAADRFKVYYSRGEDAGNGGYLMNHSNITYLFGPQGEPLATLPTDEGAEAIALELAKWVR